MESRSEVSLKAAGCRTGKQDLEEEEEEKEEEEAYLLKKWYFLTFGTFPFTRQ